ncbi:MAG: hypothetical protein CL887_06400 [Dehalococcoidia bacterium]|nr:hypothetical protein [Dehalococcoidia bacterium]|tara:strand:+ start:7245 stop:8039 length:795 start_codon:yes stop_codon:yes gene_type:complete
MNSVKIGDVEIIAVSDGYGDMDPLEIFVDSNSDDWTFYTELIDGEGHIHPRFGTTIIRTPDKTVLVDTGLQGPEGTLIKELEECGILPFQVDIVLMTHLHPDHVGWNISQGKPTFDKAMYYAPKLDWDYWTKPEVLQNADHVNDQVIPLMADGRLQLMDKDFQVTPEISTLYSPGHTPGHTSFLIKSNEESLVVLGDVAHTPAQAHHTDWNPVFDVDGNLSRKTRNELVTEFEEKGFLISAGHFPYPGLGKFVRVNGRRTWTQV